MSIKERIDGDLKQAMLGGEKDRVTTLRGLKSAILYVEVAAGKRDQGLSDDEVIPVLQKEAKSRQEAADLYKQNGQPDRADAEMAEKSIIEQYLPSQLSEEEINAIIEDVISSMSYVDKKMMGQLIGSVKSKAAGAADGATIARLVKERLDQ